MCLAIPGKVLSKEDRAGTLMGRVDFGGVTREVQLDFVPEVEVGEYVIVHVGFALSRLDAEEAARTFELLKQLGEIEESEVRSPMSEVAGPKSEKKSEV
jgi:hydrogenase expression/formation protein HypC